MQTFAVLKQLAPLWREALNTRKTVRKERHLQQAHARRLPSVRFTSMCTRQSVIVAMSEYADDVRRRGGARNG
jgi:hypothetical protein